MEDDVTALPFAVDMLLNPAGSDDLSNLNVAIRDGVKQEAAIPFLRRLVEPGSGLDIRRAAISALGHTRSPLAFAALVATLDDLDPSIQYAAAQSLARATKRSDLITSEESFRASRDRYRAFWNVDNGKRRSVDGSTRIRAGAVRSCKRAVTATARFE